GIQAKKSAFPKPEVPTRFRSCRLSHKPTRRARGSSIFVRCPENIPILPISPDANVFVCSLIGQVSAHPPYANDLEVPWKSSEKTRHCLIRKCRPVFVVLALALATLPLPAASA